MSKPTILRPEIVVPLTSGALIVRDLPWQDALEFLRKLSASAKDLLVSVSANGSVNMAELLPKLTEIITNAGDLSLFLLTKSTGKEEKFFAELGTFETLEVLDAALEVNLSDGLIALGKKVAGKMARVLPAKATISATAPSAIS